MRFPVSLFSALALAPVAFAAPSPQVMTAGKQAYEMVCLGCHQPDGKGIPGAFPPLAGSPWVSGDPERIAKIVLHGLTGPITLDGHTYHAEMPPQGSLLDDAAIAHVLTYVRNSWGNSASSVEPASITALRKKYESRSEYWDADALLKEHPLESGGDTTAPHALTDVTFKLYEGIFEKLPDFSKLKPVEEGSVAENRPSLNVRGDRAGGIAIEFDGKITTPVRGEYTFRLASDDGSRLEIDGKRVINHDGVHNAKVKSGKILLSEGTFPFRLTYFDKDGGSKLAMSWEGKSFGKTALTEDQVLGKKEIAPRIMLAADGVRARIYRNFIEGATARAIGVGYPGAINLAWDANAMRPALMWRGPFIDAGRHWTGRGQGFQPPANRNAIALPPGPQFAVLESGDAPWPEDDVRKSSKLRTGDTRFRGYELDQKGWPTFKYTIGDTEITDSYAPVLSGDIPVDQQASDAFTRTITIRGGTRLTHRIASGEIEEMGDGTYVIDDSYKIVLSPDSSEATLRNNSGSSDLLIDAEPGSTIVTTLTLLK